MILGSSRYSGNPLKTIRQRIAHVNAESHEPLHFGGSESTQPVTLPDQLGYGL